MSRGSHGHSCPHCGGATRIRDSRGVTPTYRTLRLQCLNIHCGATYGVESTITHIISPSAAPNPAVVLRQAPPRRRAANDAPPIAANDGTLSRGSEVPRPANDDDTRGAANG